MGGQRLEGQGAVAFLVLDLAKAFERVSLHVVWAWATHFSFPGRILRVFLWVFRAPEGCTVRRMCGRAAHDHHCYLARFQAELFVLRIVLQDSLSEVTKICAILKLMVFFR